MSLRRIISCLLVAVFAICGQQSFAAPGAQRMLYTSPNMKFIGTPSGDHAVTINDLSGSIATLQAAITNARATNPTNLIVITLLSNATYLVSSASLTLDSRECLVAAGATIQAANGSVTVPLVQINAGAANVSVAGGVFDGNGANINAIFAPAASHVNVDKIVVRNCGQDCILLKGQGNSTYNNDMTVTRCDVSGSAAHAGISIQNSTQTAVLDNNSHNNAVGIYLSCAWADVANNTCESNSIGIQIAGGNDNVVANNTCNNNGTGIVAGASGNMIVSSSLGNNSTAGINSSGSGNHFLNNLFTAGNTVNFTSGGSGNNIIAYKTNLNASGQNYFYPPLIDDQHTNTIVNGMGRTDLTITSTTIDNVQTQYNAARTANPNDVIVLHLNGTFTVASSPLTLQSNTCVLLTGTIQVTSTNTSATIQGGTAAKRVCVSGGTLDGGNLNGNYGINVGSGSMIQVDDVIIQNYGDNSSHHSGSDSIHYSGGSTPYMVTRCFINKSGARGIWSQLSGQKALYADNYVAYTRAGIDCDSHTFGAVCMYNLVVSNTYGLWYEQGASHNTCIGNIANNNDRYQLDTGNNADTPPTEYNSYLCNFGQGTTGMTTSAVGTNTFTSYNFDFNNVILNASINSDGVGTNNYFSQNYQAGGSLTVSAADIYFNSAGVSSNQYLIDNSSSLPLIVQGAATTNNAPIVIGAISGLDNDLWALIPTDSGYYRITNKKSKSVMAVAGASLSAGAAIVQSTFGSGKNDQWMPMSAGNGFYYFVNRLSGLALTVPLAASGTPLTQQPYSSAAGQQFSLTLIRPGVIVQPPFLFAASPASQAGIAGGSNSFTLTIVTNSTFSNSVTFSVSGLPANTTANFSPVSLFGSGTSALAIFTTTNTPPGVYSLAITATGTSATNTTTVSLIVNSGLLALPGTLQWSGGNGLNWSTLQNFTNTTAGGYGPPGTNNVLIFTNAGVVSASALTSPGSGVLLPANINSTVDTSFAVGGLFDYANAVNTSPNYHNLSIANGATLSVFTNFQVGGFTQVSLGDNNVTRMTISGAGGALAVSNGGVTVSANVTTGPNNNAMLDLSALDNFSMNGTQIRIGVEGGTGFRHADGAFYLAKTNNLLLYAAGYSDTAGVGSPSSGNPALYIGHNASNFGNGSQLYFGINNSLFMDYATVGRGDKNVFVGFNPAFTNQTPTLLIRGTNGIADRVGVYVVGDSSAGAQANGAPSTNDFTGGSVDALINYFCVGRGRNANSSSVGAAGVFTFDNGTINANTLAIGFIYPSGSNSPAVGTVNINRNAILVVNSNLFLAQAAGVAGQTAFPQGTLNINGGTVETTNIISGGGTAAINLNSGTLDLQGGQIANVSSLVIGDGISAAAQLVNASVISSTNTVAIAANGLLGGNTTLTAPSVVVNGTISPGSQAVAVGAINVTGNVISGGGSSFIVGVQDANGSPGTGWDVLHVGGQWNIQSTGVNPFTIRLQSFADGQIDAMTNFNADTNYDWVIVTAGNIANFDPAKFAIDTSFFQNDLAGGYFYIHTNANSLVLSFTNNHPPVAATYTLFQNPNGLVIPIASLATNWSDVDGDPVVLVDVNDTSTNGAPVYFDSQFIYYTNAGMAPDAVFYSVQDVRTNLPAVYRNGDAQRGAIGEIVFMPAPPIASVNVNGGSLVLGGSNGISGRTFYLLGTTNIALPMDQWQYLNTNAFDAGGNFSVTNAVDSNALQQFYRLQLQ